MIGLSPSEFWESSHGEVMNAIMGFNEFHNHAKKEEPMTVKKGDKVLYGKYAGTEITVDDTDYLIMRETDIFAII